MYIQETTKRLIELWLNEENKKLRRQAAWAICSVCKQQLEVADTPELRKAIEENISNPQNDYDDRAALYLGILCKYWSREETQRYLDSIRSIIIIDEVRFLEDLGYKQKTKDWEPIESK